MHQRRNAQLGPAQGLGLLLLLLSCRSPAPDTLEFRDSEAGRSLQVSTSRSEDRLEVTFATETAVGSIPVAKITGVRLAVQRGEGRREILLPFAGVESEAEALELRCDPTLGHEIRLRIERDEDRSMRVELEDRVGVRSSLLELSLEYEFLAAGPIDESSTPHIHPGEEDLAGDMAFQAPVAFLRADEISLALSPDLELLQQQRRLPQGLIVTRSPGRIRHGLMAQAHRAPAGPFGPRTFTQEGAEAVQVRAETLTFGHFILIDGAARPHRSLAEAQSQNWRRYMSSDLKRSAAPMGELTWDQICTRYLDRMVAENWRDIDLGEIDAGSFTEAASGIDARFDAEEQLLRVAYVMASRADRQSQPRMAELARRILDLVLAAPRRAGLIPARFTSTVDASQSNWELGATEAASALGHHALDSAVSAYWMLKIAQLLPDRKASTYEACRKLAYFFLLNQHSNGAIPVWYGREYLEPLEDPKWAADTAGPAMFLSEYAKLTKDERVLEAARKAVRFLEDEALAPAFWPEPIRAPGDAPGLSDARSGNAARSPFLLCLAARACLTLVDVTGDPLYSTLLRTSSRLSASTSKFGRRDGCRGSNKEG